MSQLYRPKQHTVVVDRRRVSYLDYDYYIVAGPGFTELLKEDEFHARYEPIPGSA